MASIVYKAELSKAAEIWAQKNGYWSVLQALPDMVLANLHCGDFLELESAAGKTTLFSVLRRTVRIAATGEASVVLFLDHPAR
ncbi:hypothetical protein [Pseudochrobactrum sp. MP213Fo]|uniref:hypothetical protein n=1 Tax=Pseudochrobactrum sp. MP213Fo TaxID=3022250 RepID=UPI003B9FB961